MVEIKQAVIFAGGLGERLRPLTNDRPKPMVLVNDKPFLEHLISLLKENGIREVLILLGYLPKKIKNYFGDGSNFGIKINYHIGQVDDETGTRLNNAKHLLHNHFLLMYGDNYWPMNLKKMIDFYENMGVLGSTTVYNNQDGGAEYGAENNVQVSQDGYVLKYDKNRQDPDLNGVDIGFFIMNKKVLDLVPVGNFSFEREVLSQLASMQQLVGFRTDHPYYWMTTLESVKIMGKFLSPKKVVFLDRDGVINKKIPDHCYVTKWDEFEFLPGIVEALKQLDQDSYQIYIITNQQGVGRGVMTEANLVSIHQQMLRELSRHGVTITDIYYCPHNKTDYCDCRKPRSGLLFRAAREHYLDLTRVILIGDSQKDIDAGATAGCQTILLPVGKDLLEMMAISVGSK